MPSPCEPRYRSAHHRRPDRRRRHRSAEITDVHPGSPRGRSVPMSVVNVTGVRHTLAQSSIPEQDWPRASVAGHRPRPPQSLRTNVCGCSPGVAPPLWCGAWSVPRYRRTCCRPWSRLSCVFPRKHVAGCSVLERPTRRRTTARQGVVRPSAPARSRPRAQPHTAGPVIAGAAQCRPSRSTRPVVHPRRRPPKSSAPHRTALHATRIPRDRRRGRIARFRGGTCGVDGKSAAPGNDRVW